MATYLELSGLYTNADLLRKIEVALLIRAQSYLDAGTPTAAQRAWSRAVFDQPRNEAQKMLLYLLAKNSGQSVATITGSSDATLQSQVDAVAAQFVSAFTGT